MADIDDFVEVDEFSGAPQPGVADESEEALRQILRERQGAYTRIFMTASVDDRHIVMTDLAEFCRAYTSAFTADERSTALLLGRGEVYQRIVDFARLSNDELFVKYHERALKRGT